MFASVVALLAVVARADEPVDAGAGTSEEPYVVTIIGNDPHAVDDVPGSAWVVTAEELARQRPISTSEALQQVPGITVQDEDGVGLRQNIGVRGLDPNRSRKVLILEDGMPIALAPYGEPEMYYTPPVERMERIEVVKGSGAVLFGPQSIGGVVNYVTPRPPEDLEVTVGMRAGTWGLLSGMVDVGDTVGRVGWSLSALHQRFGGPRDLDLARTDVTGKVQLALSDRQTLTWKLGVYDEQSAATYLGLTTPQFERDPDLQLAVHDHFSVRRYGLGGTHAVVLGANASLRTLLYAHHVQRDWWRQDFDRSDLGFDYERIVDGRGREVDAADDDGSSIFFRDSTALRGRRFDVAGVEPRLRLGYRAGGADSSVDLGARLHWEQAHEVRVEGDSAAARSGRTTDEDVRTGVAVAAYVLHRTELAGGRIALSPGARLEVLATQQRVLRAKGAGRTDLPWSSSATHVAVLPGLGWSARPVDPITFYGGVHRGWAPPRTKDAVTTDGATLDLEAERSWNWEAGVRGAWSDWVHADVAAFWLDFGNQVIPPSEAGGATAGTAVNGGKTRHLGVESSVRADPLAAAGVATRLPLTLHHTFVDARFGSGWSAAVQGQPLPYAPRHQVAASVGVEVPFDGALAGANVKGAYVGSQYTDQVATVAPSMDGLVGRIDARVVFDAQVSVRHDRTGVSAFVAAKNLLDTVYVSTRTPRGIQPGLRRHVFGGIECTF